ncbi:MAG: 30S ribosomal protein S18 [Candidatus Omnitrophica bacterium]|jgi:small subunit ribosomal protein S18|nr:30S ribosomal protein S18 [Candidatus Omnitrophota bacterium]
MRDKKPLFKKNLKKDKNKLGILRKKVCRMCLEKVKGVDYKDVRRLEFYVRDRGKIASVRATGNCARHQRMASEALKKARFLSLIPYVRS